MGEVEVEVEFVMKKPLKINYRVTTSPSPEPTSRKASCDEISLNNQHRQSCDSSINDDDNSSRRSSSDHVYLPLPMVRKAASPPSPQEHKVVDTAALSDIDERKLMELQEAFMLFDLNQDGIIDKQDLIQTFQTLGQNDVSENEVLTMLSEAPNPLNFDNFVHLLGYKTIELDDEETLIHALSQWDYDNSGLISEEHCVRGDFIKLFLHLEGRGEVNEYTPWAGLLCGSYTDIPQVFYSSGPGLVFEFHSDRINTNSTGFKGTFRFLDKRLFQTDGQKLPGTMCDHQFVSSEYSPSHGTLYSPRYPSSYPKNIRCSYRFRARAKERIQIIFEEVVLQKGDLSCINRADVIKVHDGRTSDAPTIKMICNTATETEILSTGPDLYIEFVANSERPGQGFKATYQFQPIDELSADENVRNSVPTHPMLGPAVSAATSSCDTVFNSDTTKNGTVSSPNYPSPYSARSHCRYDFQGRGKERIQITFNDFNLYHPTDNPKECDNIDSVIAFIHIDGRMEKIDMFCGSNLPKPIMSNGPRLMLEFHGMLSSRYSKGFKATYSFTENFGITSGRQLSEFPCAFVFNSNESQTGAFSSPNYPGFYPRDTECHYFFYGLPKERVRLHFTYFDVEGVSPCEAISASDYLEFSNFMARDRKYSRYCGQLKEFDVESDRKFFRVTFRSNDRLDGTGFHATYRFTDEVETISSQPERPINSFAMNVFVSEVVLQLCFITFLINNLSWLI